MLWHSIVQELWKRSPKMTSKEQQQTSSALLKKSRQGTQKANPLCLNKSVIIFVCRCCLHQLIHVTLNVLLCSCWAFWVLFEYCPVSWLLYELIWSKSWITSPTHMKKKCTCSNLWGFNMFKATDFSFRFELALQQNEILDVFYDDYLSLADDETTFGAKSDNYLKVCKSLSTF